MALKRCVTPPNPVYACSQCVSKCFVRVLFFLLSRSVQHNGNNFILNIHTTVTSRNLAPQQQPTVSVSANKHANLFEHKHHVRCLFRIRKRITARCICGRCEYRTQTKVLDPPFEEKNITKQSNRVSLIKKIQTRHCKKELVSHTAESVEKEYRTL